ncbi:MAG TPA: ion channel [Solirubrobacterales bacterium]|nr:ion channel [Solirubrobacterales bacterium]
MATDLIKRNIRPFLPSAKQLQSAEWPLEKGAIRILWLLLLICPFWWLIDRWEPDNATERKAQKDRLNLQRAYWVGGWLALLGVIWLINPEPSAWKWLFAGLALIRLIEVFTSGLGTIVRQDTQVGASNLVTIAIYAAQLTLIFAILDHSFAMTEFASDSSVQATRASDYLYISWSDLTTIGNNIYTPQNSVARYLELLTTTSGLLLLTVLVAFGINTIKPKEK